MTLQVTGEQALARSKVTAVAMCKDVRQKHRGMRASRGEQVEPGPGAEARAHGNGSHGNGSHGNGSAGSVGVLEQGQT